MFILPQKGGEEGAQSGGVAVELGYTEANLEKNLEEKLKRFSIWTSHQLERECLSCYYWTLGENIAIYPHT
jgi:hypothetical protein